MLHANTLMILVDLGFSGAHVVVFCVYDWMMKLAKVFGRYDDGAGFFDFIPFPLFLDAFRVFLADGGLVADYPSDRLFEQPRLLLFYRLPSVIFDDVIVVVFAVLECGALESLAGVLVGQHEDGGDVDGGDDLGQVLLAVRLEAGQLVEVGGRQQRVGASVHVGRRVGVNVRQQLFQCVRLQVLDLQFVQLGFDCRRTTGTRAF